MKRLFFALVAMFLFVGCQYDDSGIWNELNKQKFEALCNQMNTNTQSLQTMITVSQNNDTVMAVAPVTLNGENVGYTITFKKSGTITVYHNNDVANGHSPIISAKQDSDGVYYWTLDGEWIVDASNNKIAIIKEEGKTNITPLVKIEDNSWHISYNNGTTWTKLNYEIDNNDISVNSVFTSISDDDKCVYINLKDGSNLVLYKYKDRAELLSLSFKSAQNPSILTEDLYVDILDENICECIIPHIVFDKKLIPVFKYIGEAVYVDNKEITSGETKLDFSKPVTFDILGEDGVKVSYTVNVRAFTGLPVMTINTVNGIAVNSKDKYRDATIKIVEDITTRASGDVFETTVKIKGRGNTTWFQPKKPYKLKFNEKVSLFGEAKDKEWVLLANYWDPSLIRNDIAMFMGKKSLIPYTSSSHYAEVILNGVYIGTYEVMEQNKISENRVNVTDNGFLLEVDAKAEASDVTFRVGSIPQPINIKDPDVPANSEAYNYIVNFMQTVENTLYGANWLDPENGWQKYMDMDSFVDWYLINEISRNNDAVFFTSCFMHHAPGEKLFMGPLWDYDLAFGNYSGTNSNPEGFYIKDNIGWYIRLFSDPEFVKRVKERYEYFYSIKDEILNHINASAKYLELSAVENHNKWGVLYTVPQFGYSAFGAYYNEVSYLRQWLIDRMEWLKTAYEQM